MIPFTPMLCVTGDPSDIQRYVHTHKAEYKLDGWRVMCSIEQDRARVFAGRNGACYDGQLPHIEKALAETLPAGTIVDGELIGRTKWGDVQSAMTTNTPHVQDDLTYVIFDVLQVHGHDVRKMVWEKRRNLVEHIRVDDGRLAISQLVPLSENTFQQSLDAGYEGLVLKKISAPYIHGKSSSMIKLKAAHTLDCKIVDLPHDGKNGLAGLVGAVRFELPNGQVGRASGMTMTVRRAMTFHPHLYVGKMAEFAYQEITEDGRMRSPRFKRMRPDLDRMKS